jgi:hypothetical protein
VPECAFDGVSSSLRLDIFKRACTFFEENGKIPGVAALHKQYKEEVMKEANSEAHVEQISDKDDFIQSLMVTPQQIKTELDRQTKRALGRLNAWSARTGEHPTSTDPNRDMRRQLWENIDGKIQSHHVGHQAVQKYSKPSMPPMDVGTWISDGEVADHESGSDAPAAGGEAAGGEAAGGELAEGGVAGGEAAGGEAFFIYVLGMFQ